MARRDVSVKQPAGVEESTRPGHSYRPNADIGETSEGVWLAVDLPGVDEKSVRVDLEDGVLSIEAQVALDEYETLRPLYSEYNVGNFERRFRISDRIDASRIGARIEHGVLHLHLPKAEAAQPRTIPVQIG